MKKVADDKKMSKQEKEERLVVLSLKEFDINSSEWVQEFT